MNDRKNIFIAHCGEHEDRIEDFKNLLSQKGYDFRDSSHTLNDPNCANNEAYAKTLVRQSINWAGTVIVLIGRDTAKNDWINWEIKAASKIGDKQIIGVYLPTSQEYSVPQALLDYGDALVRWNSDSISRVLDGHYEWHNPDGTIRQDYEIPRSTC